MSQEIEQNQGAISSREALRLGMGLAATGMLARVEFADIPLPTKVVKTTNGVIQGLVQGGVQIFKGIRYGAEPVGALRFMPPQKPEPWKEIADATEFSSRASSQSLRKRRSAMRIACSSMSGHKDSAMGGGGQ